MWVCVVSFGNWYYMKIAFQMDPLDNINFASDTTWQLIIEAVNRGIVYHYTPAQLSWHDGKLLAHARQVHIAKDHSYTLLDQQVIDLSEMDVIWVRQDPPYDMAYLTTTYLLEKVADQVLIINNPKAIRNFPEKISVLDYPDLIPPTLITYDYQEAMDFAKKYDRAIIKPLYSFAGSDVFCLAHNDINFANVMTNLIQIHKTPVIIQKFIPEVTLGDKRIILVNGEPVGAFIRKPKAGDIRANLACGGEAIPSDITDHELKICQAIRPKLVENGLFFVGIDVIAGYLTEINVTSPTGVVKIQAYSNPKIVTDVWDAIEDHIKVIV